MLNAVSFVHIYNVWYFSFMPVSVIFLYFISYMADKNKVRLGTRQINFNVYMEKQVKIIKEVLKPKTKQNRKEKEKMVEN